MALADAFDAEVVLGRAGEATLSLGAPIVETGGFIRFPLRLEAAGLTVSHEIELEESWGGGADKLFSFVDELAAGWQGWSGAKEWSDDHQLTQLSATHDGTGTVLLDVRLKQGYEDTGSWSVRAFVPVDPGAFEAAARSLRNSLARGAD